MAEEKPIKVRFHGEVYWKVDDLIAPLSHFDAEGELLADPFYDISYAVIEGEDILRYHQKIGTVDELEVLDGK